MVKTLPPIYLENSECLFEDERSKFHSLSVDESVCADHCRRLILKEQVESRREKWISLTFKRPDCPNHLESGSRQHRDLVKGERSKFHLLTIDKIVQNIADDWSGKERDLSEEDKSEFQLLLIDENMQIIVDDCPRKAWLSREERSEFKLLSVAGIVEIIIERGSRKDRYLGEETGKWISLIFWSATMSETLSSIDLETTNWVEERDENFTHFDRWVCLDHCWRLI